MTSKRNIESRLDALAPDTGEENVVGWFDFMDYSIRHGGSEDPPSPEEVFGRGYTFSNTGWAENLRASGYTLPGETGGGQGGSR